MGLFGTSNSTLMNTMQSNQQSQFKTMNNLLTLQENHVEDFFQYHGEAFLAALAQLIEDTVQKVLGQMLPELKFTTDSAGVMNMHSDATSAFGTITEANINLDLQTLLASAINSEVIMQRRMAKAQYLESQGFATPAGEQQQLSQQQMAFNNQSGYPVPPAGYDNMNNPYWIDPVSGQMSYTPPASGLGLANAVSKGIAWAKWLA